MSDPRSLVLVRAPLSLILDTNVWVDLYYPTRKHHKDVIDLVSLACRNDITLYYSTHSITDAFYLIKVEQKGLLRSEVGQLTESLALGANETAWACIRNMREIGVSIPISDPILAAAAEMKGVHTDFEDDVVLAAAQMAGVDFLVTNDKTLVSKSIVPALTAKDMLAYLNARY